MALIRSLSHQIVIFLLVFISPLFLNTCKEDAPTEPEGNNNNNVLASSTIGPSGGELKTDDFSLTVPAGSFQSETTLSLSISDELSFLEENSISKSFTINGLPDQFEKPIRVKIKYEGELSDSSYITRTMIGEDNITGENIDISYYMQTNDSSGYLVGEIFPQSKQSMNILSKATVPEIIKDVFEGKTSIKTVKTSKFVIKYPSIYSETIVRQFGDLLENTFNRMTTELGLVFKNRNWPENSSCLTSYNNHEYCWRWPIPIYIVDISDKIRLGYGKWFSPVGPILNADGTIMGSSIGTEAELLIGQKLLEIALRTNRHYGLYVWWFGEAIENWLEEFFKLINDKETPSTLQGNELAPFDGMQAGANDYSYTIKHGDGMVTLIKYLLKYKLIEESGFQNIINYMEENKVPIVNALLTKTNEFVAKWWPDYFQKLITGELYDVNSSVFLDSKNLGGTWDIKSETDTDTSFTLEYPDLSAKRFIINLNYPDIDESAKLSLDAFSLNNDGIATILFGVKSNGDFQHIITAKNAPAEIHESLKNYYDKGIRKLLVVVVNSIHNAMDYLGKTDIELQMRITKEEPTPDYNYCGISIYCGMRKVYTTPDTSYERENNKIHLGTWEKYGGSFSGHTFNASYQNDQLKKTGEISVAFNNDFSMITNISWNESHNHAEYNSTGSTDFIGTNIPLDDLEWGTVYQVKGEESCNHIVTLSDVQSAADGLSWTMPEYWCNGDSKIYISFSKE